MSFNRETKTLTGEALLEVTQASTGGSTSALTLTHRWRALVQRTGQRGRSNCGLKDAGRLRVLRTLCPFLSDHLSSGLGSQKAPGLALASTYQNGDGAMEGAHGLQRLPAILILVLPFHTHGDE